ncbi:MAG: anion permease, partial [Burkholderiaceae bacterium]|nr:anion permease [Burkholderiaceae bacterium]
MRPLEFARGARLLAGPLAFALAWLLLPGHFPGADGTPVAFSPAGRATLAMAAWMAIWWLSEAVPLEATALLPVALFPLLGIAGIAEATAPYASDVVFLFLGGFVLAAGLQRWGLDRRIAFAVLARAGAEPAQVLAAVMIATTFLGLWVSNTATAAIMIPIAVSIAGFARFDDAAAAGRFAAALVLAVAYSASIGGMATLIGSPPNGIAARFIAQTTGEPISFAHWMLIASPASALMLLACWWWLARRLPPAGAGDAAATRAAIAGSAASLGPMGRGETTTLAVCALTASLWILRPLLAPIEVGAGRPFA